ncbi:MAG: MgtC/SapB family protein [Clostridiales bacterium]|nr:MgtC/SapB family protein [Clostridiales bacterium]MBE7101238.1 MgtC/SapB family protein [Clostridiales bacterium]
MKELLFESRILLDILLAVALGFTIGLERRLRSKEAGIRTHTIVCVGSALLMVVSKYAFGDAADSARVAAQIVSGVGFLGAGMIVYKRNEVYGLTTAAGVWATAGVGMACGGRLYYVAIGATIILIGFQFLFHAPIFRNKKTYSVNIEFIQTESENKIIKGIFGTDRFNHLIIKRRDSDVIYSATLNTDKEFSSTRLNEIMAENPFILSIVRCEND